MSLSLKQLPVPQKCGGTGYVSTVAGSVPIRIYPAASTRSNRAHNHIPAGMGLIWLHGGGFAYGDLAMPEAHTTAAGFAAHNVTVISVDYRLCVGGTTWPSPSDDVLAAWEWTHEHAEELGLDPQRLLLGGASAGGNLAAGAVLRLLENRPEKLPKGVFLAYPTVHAVQPPTPEKIKALVARTADPAAFSALNLLAMYENYLGGPVTNAPIAAIPGTAKPSQLLGFPPTIMVNNEADELRVSGEAFADLLVRAGTPVEVVTEPGTQHGHLNTPGDAAALTVQRVVDWASLL